MTIVTFIQTILDLYDEIDAASHEISASMAVVADLVSGDGTRALGGDAAREAGLAGGKLLATLALLKQLCVWVALLITATDD
jgi:hypothetical protein